MSIIFEVTNLIRSFPVRALKLKHVYLFDKFVMLKINTSLSCYNFYILIREGIRFMQNGTPPSLSNVHVLRPSKPEKMVFANVSVCL